MVNKSKCEKLVTTGVYSPGGRNDDIVCRIHIERLKKEAAEISGGEMVAWSSHQDEDSPAVEEFWERVVEFENAPRGTQFAQLHKAGVALPPPDSLTDAELHGKLWEVINKLAELRVFLYRTNHLSDRELYARLWDDLLREETTILPPDPDSACHLDVIGSGSEEDVELGLKYYDDEEERCHWQKSFPGYPIPDHEDPPYIRPMTVIGTYRNGSMGVVGMNNKESACVLVKELGRFKRRIAMFITWEPLPLLRPGGIRKING